MCSKLLDIAQELQLTLLDISFLQKDVENTDDSISSVDLG